MFLQSGNYFNTIGWMSVELDNNNAERDLVMTRRYLDNNVPTFMVRHFLSQMSPRANCSSWVQAHTEIADEAKFHTKQGRNITDYIYGLERAAGLSQVYGYLESGKNATIMLWIVSWKRRTDYFLDRKTWSEQEEDPESLFSFYLNVSDQRASLVHPLTVAPVSDRRSKISSLIRQSLLTGCSSAIGEYYVGTFTLVYSHWAICVSW